MGFEPQWRGGGGSGGNFEGSLYLLLNLAYEIYPRGPGFG